MLNHAEAQDHALVTIVSHSFELASRDGSRANRALCRRFEKLCGFLAAHAERKVALLSAGQRERVALARAFAARTPVVLADEPTSRLDAATTLEIGGLLAELAHATGTTVMCATHDPRRFAMNPWPLFRPPAPRVGRPREPVFHGARRV